jgi:hypothetical protein
VSWCRGVVFSVGLACTSCGSESSGGTRGDETTVPSGEFCPTGVAYPDHDGDGYASSVDPETEVACELGRAPPGYTPFFGDCDDGDPEARLVYNRDADGDGVGSATDTTCAGENPPEGYLREAGQPDCDDSDPDTALAYYVDADGDGHTAPDPARYCGPPDEAPFDITSINQYPRDCDDTDPAAYFLVYPDRDGDGFAGSTDESFCAGDPPPTGYGFDVWWDCDDTRTDVNVLALEQWEDGIDSDCDGHDKPFGCGDAGCDPFAAPVPVVDSCASADLRIDQATASGRCGGVDWTVVIANQGTEPVSDYTLTIDAPESAPSMRFSYQTRSFAIADPLSPGARHGYSLPRNPTLSGNVTFSVSHSGSDCDGANDVLTEVGFPEPCPEP